MRVAIIGAGGAGLTAAWLLEPCHEVTLYEQDELLGGHARTVEINLGGTRVPVDAGMEFLSESMCPVFSRLLDVLNVPCRSYPVTATQFDVRTGEYYLLPPLRNGVPYLPALRPQQIRTMLNLAKVLRAFAPIMAARDTSLTVEAFVEPLDIPRDFKTRFLYPFLQAGWCVPLEDLKQFIIYDVLSWIYLHQPTGLTPKRWLEIVGGTRTYVNALGGALRNTCIRTCTPVVQLHLDKNGWIVEENSGRYDRYDHVVVATSAEHAGRMLHRLPSMEPAWRLLNQIDYFDTTIAIHGDTRLMPPNRKHWSVVNSRIDGMNAQNTIWRYWREGMPIFKSWVTYDVQMPEPLYQLVRFRHPKINAAYFNTQSRLQELSGEQNIWMAGLYMHDIDNHESAIHSAMNIARHLAPGSSRLLQLTN